MSIQTVVKQAFSLEGRSYLVGQVVTFTDDAEAMWARGRFYVSTSQTEVAAAISGGAAQLTHGVAGFQSGPKINSLRVVRDEGGGFDRLDSDSGAVLANSGFGKLPRGLRNVTTKCAPPNAAVSQPKFGGRVRMTATETMYTMAQVLSAWRVNGSNQAEENIGNDVSYRSSVEYPVGSTRQPFTLAGNTTMVCPNGEDIETDLLPLAVPIPAGAAFFICIYAESGGGLIPYHAYNGPADMTYPLPGTLSASGEGFVFGSGASDVTQTLANPIQGTFGANWRPTAILTNTTNHSLALVGDSRTCISATYDGVDNPLGTQGQLERLVNGRLGTINLAISGDGLYANTQLGNFIKRRRLFKYCSVVMIVQGINDAVSRARTAVQMLGDLATFKTFCGALPMIACTVYPRVLDTTSGFTSVAAQAPDTSNVAVAGYNTALRQGQVADYCVEIADLVTSSRDSGVFKVVGRVVNDATINGTAVTSASGRFAAAERFPEPATRCVFLGAGAGGNSHSFQINAVVSATALTASAAAATNVASNGTLYIGTATFDGLHLLPPGIKQIQENGKLPAFLL